jgi:hypothetical protein
MQPIEVDEIGPRPAQQIFAGCDDGLAIRAARIGIASEVVGAEIRCR